MLEFLFGRSKKSCASNSETDKEARKYLKKVAKELKELKKIHDWMDALTFILKGGNPNAIDENGNTFLHCFPDQTDFFISKGVSPKLASVKNNDGYIPLAMMALCSRRIEPTLIKITPKAFLNEIWPNGETILTSSLKHGLQDVRAFQTLLSAGADFNQPNAEGVYPKDLVCNTLSYFDYVVVMTQHGLSISDIKISRTDNLTGQMKQIPLLFDMMSQSYDVKETEDLLYILKSANLSVHDNDDNTLLHVWASDFNKNHPYSQQFQNVFLQLNQQIDINAKNNFGMTPLMSALDKGTYTARYRYLNGTQRYQIDREIAVKILLDHGADVKLTDNDGNTALHYAVHAGLTEIIPLLVKAGGQPWIKNKEGKLPHEYAKGIAHEYLRNLAICNINDEQTDCRFACNPVVQKVTSQLVSGQHVTYDNQNIIK